MSSAATGVVVLICAFGGGLLGMWLGTVLPAAHLAEESRDTVRLGMGLVATISALVLGLVVADAKSSYDAQQDDLTQFAADLVLLDRALAHYGPETGEARALLRRSAIESIDEIWTTPASGMEERDRSVRSAFFDEILRLSPQNDEQRSMKTLAISLSVDLARALVLMTEHRRGSVPAPFLVVLTLWLTILFASFGLFAPRNITVLVTLLVSAVAVSGAIYLIVQLHQPWGGLIQISNTPLRTAVTMLGR